MAEALTLTTLSLVLVATFLLGFLTGWLLSNKNPISTQKKLRILVAVVISLAWLSATIAGIIVGSYTVSPLIHALMGGIVGYFFTEDGITLTFGGE